MEPVYFLENKYSYFISKKQPLFTSGYQVESPESSFELQVQQLYQQAQEYLQHEEYLLALQRLKELQTTIFRTVHPTLPVNNDISDFALVDMEMFPALLDKSIEILNNTPVKTYTYPSTIFSKESVLPIDIKTTIDKKGYEGVTMQFEQNVVIDPVLKGNDFIEAGNYKEAITSYNDALTKTTDPAMQAVLSHDLAVLNDQINNVQASQKFSAQSVALSSSVKDVNFKTRINAFNEKIAAPLEANNISNTRSRSFTATAVAPSLAAISLTENNASMISINNDLLTTSYINTYASTKTVMYAGTTENISIVLDTNAQDNFTSFYKQLSTTADIKLLTGYKRDTLSIVSYLPHMYFFIIPMCIGDCQKGLGDLTTAEATYKSVLAYPYINQTYEIPKLWSRLADVYLTLGAQSYRAAKDSIAQYGTAKSYYEKIIMSDNTVNTASALYADGKFSSVRTRVQNFMALPDPLSSTENPVITSRVWQAKTMLMQLNAGLNYFGFGIDYYPPFSFEYLQTTARYFAQQASQIEQRYIQFKSTAEDEELRREQMNQQAEVARQSVILEQRGVAEAQAGVAVAQASVNYAETQRQNAQDAADSFDDVRWELLEYAEAEAWANAASVDHDDEVLLTWSGNYYNANDKGRPHVIQDLAYRRTEITNELEAEKLQAAVEAAEAYKGIAEAQANQANARVDVAQQRVVVAQLQQQFAEDNRDFLDMQEFSSSMWYDLAAQSKQIANRYLDMANEVAFLMERAYNEETERGLHVIQYDYTNTSSGNLLGSQLLLTDIDYFSYDYITTTKTKKAPVKKTISLADNYPTAFQQLKNAGKCFFQTNLAQFDRENPGMYLCKLRYVELIFVGITRAASLAGSLRNIGISKFRKSDGSVVSRLYPSDVMPLSQYDIRQDSLAYRFNPNDLRLFENNGIDTMWQLNMPLSANDMDYSQILDIQLVMYYDGFFSTNVETAVIAALPTTGSSTRVFSMKFTFPDELYFLRNQGNAKLSFDKTLFPYNIKDMQRTEASLKFYGSDDAEKNLTFKLKSATLGTEMVCTTNADGELSAATAPLNALLAQSMIDDWEINISADDNAAKVADNTFSLNKISEVMIYFKFNFNYRS